MLCTGSALSEELATPEVEKWVKEWLQTASPLDRQQVTFCTITHDPQQNERIVDTVQEQFSSTLQQNATVLEAKNVSEEVMHVIPGSRSSI